MHFFSFKSRSGYSAAKSYELFAQILSQDIWTVLCIENSTAVVMKYGVFCKLEWRSRSFASATGEFIMYTDKYYIHREFQPTLKRPPRKVLVCICIMYLLCVKNQNIDTIL